MSKQIFNLLKPLEPPPNVWDKIYDWILGRARVIILITELVVVFAFAAKVVIDTEAKNKQDEVEQLQRRITLLESGDGPYFRTLIQKQNEYLKLWNNTYSYGPILDEIYSYINSSQSDLTISVSDKEIVISGKDSLEELQSLEVSLQNSDSFTASPITDLVIEKEDILTNEGNYSLVIVVDNNVLKREQL